MRSVDEKQARARTVIWPGDIPRLSLPYSPALKAGGWVFVSGQLASNYAQGIPDEAEVDPESPFRGDSQELQSRYILKNLEATLRAAGCDIRRDVVRIYQWFPSPWPNYHDYERDTAPWFSISPYLRTRSEFIDEPRPASTAVRIRQLLAKGAKLEIDLIAMEPSQGEKLGFDAPEGVGAPVAGYSPAIRRGNWVFLAGMLATDFQGDFGRSEHWGEPSALAAKARINPYFWYGSDIETQTDYTLAALEKIAAAADTSFNRLVKATVYLAHPADWYGMDRVWRRWFPDSPPARVVLPYIAPGAANVRVEIAMKLLAGDAPLTIERIETSDAPEPFGHEPQAVKAGNFLFFSTQLPFDSNGRLAAETKRNASFPYHDQPAKLQVRYMLKNVAAICQAAGTSLENICRRQAFHDDFTWFAQAMEEWHAHFPKDPPTSTSLEVGGPLLVPGAHVLLDLIGYVPG